MLAGPIVPTILTLAAPNVLNVAMQSLVSIADGYFIGQLGVVDLAALALVFPTQMTLGLMTAEHVLPPTVWGECAQRVCVYHMMFCEATRHGSAVRHPANFWSSASAPRCASVAEGLSTSWAISSI